MEDVSELSEWRPLEDVSELSGGTSLEDVSDLRSWKISVGCVRAYWRRCQGLQEEDLCRMCQNFQEGDPFEDVLGLTGGRSLEDVSEFP